MTQSKLNKLRRSEWIKATAIRLVRTFCTTILGCWTADTLITAIDWRSAFLTAISATVYVFILCIVAGLPEVDDTKIYIRSVKDDIDVLEAKDDIED